MTSHSLVQNRQLVLLISVQGEGLDDTKSHDQLGLIIESL